jgi:hypothetical protein
MTNPTVATGYPRALLDFAVSRGADRPTLIERSDIRPDDIEHQDTRISLTNYIAMLRTGIELCNEPALSLLFCEAVKLQDISIVGLMCQAFENVEDCRRLLNRYSRLALDEDNGDTSDRMVFVREDAKVC